MAQDAQVPSDKNINEQELKEKSNVTDQTYDPRDLPIKPGYAAEKNAEEVVDNPAVTPEMLNEARGEDNRRDLRSDT
jgi:hypothetical protein